MANIRVTCPACKTDLEIDSVHEGQEVECGNCLERFVAERPRPKPAPSIPGRDRDDSSGGSGGGRRDDDDRDRDRERPRSRRPPPRRRRRRDDDYDDYDDDYDYAPPRRERSGPGEGDAVAVIACVFGVLSFATFCIWPLSVVLGLTALVTGIFGLKSRNNKAAAVVGLVFGLIGLTVVLFIFLLAAGNPFFFR